MKNETLHILQDGESVVVEVRGLEVMFNRGEFNPGEWGVAPTELPYATVRQNAVIQDDRGLFSRTDLDYPALAKRFTADPAHFGLTDWQLLNQASWKAEHGTRKSGRRFTHKLLEEIDEFSDVLESYTGSPSARHALTSETGDVLWCAEAICSNSGVRLETAIQRKLLSEALGNVLLKSDHTPVSPGWKKAAGKIALRNIKQNTIGHIETLFNKGYIPTDATGFLLPEDEFDDPIETLPNRDSLRLTAAIIQNMVQIQFEDTDDEYILFQTQGSFAYRGERIAAVTANLFMNVLYAAKRVGGIGFSEIALENYQKTTGRVMANLVDKTDGERPSELR